MEQLKTIFEICKAHGWVSQEITKLGKKNEYWFKISNKAFAEIYKLAGPMSDKRKDKWAKLLCERACNTKKDRKIKEKLLMLLAKRKMSTTELCLEIRRLPYTVTRHLRELQKEGKIKKIGNFWTSADAPANSPS